MDVCPWCDEALQEGDAAALMNGGKMHIECFVREIVGSVAHQEKRCDHFGGSDDCDEKHATRREAARAAHVYFKRGIAH
jgi:hypothetical protein